MTTTVDQIKTEVQNAPSLYGRPIAVLHQAVTPPSLNGAVKPSNPFVTGIHPQTSPTR